VAPYDPSFREFPADQILAPRQLKALLARVQMERARAKVANMFPEELLDAVRKEVLEDLSEETRQQIRDIAADVAATNGPPRTQAEKTQMIKDVRDRLQNEMPDAWRQLSDASEKKRETFEQIQKLVPEFGQKMPGGFSERTTGNGETITLDPDGSPSLDALLEEFMRGDAEPRARNDRTGNGTGGNSGTGGNNGTGGNSGSSGISGIGSENTRRIIERLRLDGRQTTLADRPDTNPTSGERGSNPRDPSETSNELSHRGDDPPGATEELPTMERRPNMTMAERFNRMVKDVSDRTNAAETKRKSKSGESKLGGFKPYFDRLSKSLQSSMNDSFAQSTDEQRSRSRGRNRSRRNNDGSFLGLSRRDHQPPPTPSDHSLGEAIAPLFLFLAAIGALLFIRNRSVLLQGADRYLGQFSKTRRRPISHRRPEGLVEAVDQLVLSQFDMEAAIWNHTQIQVALNSVKPDLGSDIQQMMAMYKSDRYSPDSQGKSSSEPNHAVRSLLDNLYSAFAEQQPRRDEREQVK